MCVYTHALESQICFYWLKINRMALVKTVSTKPLTSFLKNSLLPEVEISTYSWYGDQQTQPSGSLTNMSTETEDRKVKGQEAGSTIAARRDLRNYPDESPSLASKETKAQRG